MPAWTFKFILHETEMFFYSQESLSVATQTQLESNYYGMRFKDPKSNAIPDKQVVYIDTSLLKLASSSSKCDIQPAQGASMCKKRAAPDEGSRIGAGDGGEKIAMFKTELAHFKEEARNYMKEARKANEKLEASEGEIKQLKTALTESDEDIEKLKKDQAQTTNEVHTLKTKLAESDAQIEALQTKLAESALNFMTQLAQYSTELNASKVEVRAITAELAQAQAAAETERDAAIKELLTAKLEMSGGGCAAEMERLKVLLATVTVGKNRSESDLQDIRKHSDHLARTNFDLTNKTFDLEKRVRPFYLLISSTSTDHNSQVENLTGTVDFFEKKGCLSNDDYKSAGGRIQELENSHKSLFTENNQLAEQIQKLQADNVLKQKIIAEHLAAVRPYYAFVRGPKTADHALVHRGPGRTMWWTRCTRR